MADRRPRVLIPITYGFSVRYLVPTGLLARMSESVEPVVGLGWDDPELDESLRQAGVATVRLPPAELSPQYRAFRRRLAVVHDRRLATPTRPIRRRRQLAMMPTDRSRWISRIRASVDRAVTAAPGEGERLEAREAGEIDAGTNVGDFARLLSDVAADALLSLTPYHDQDALLLWAARQAGLRTVASVISFDNPTTRERLVVRPDRIAVWNQFNASELLRSYPDLTPDRVAVVGAPQFDLHHRPELVMERAEWCRSVGVPADRPILLYGAGPPHLVPEEPTLVAYLDGAISDGRLRGAPFLLVRRHPTDSQTRWEDLAASLNHGTVVEPWAHGRGQFQGWPTDEDIRLQMSSLSHSAVHLNVCSSMTLDGAVFDRPQVGPTSVPGAARAENRRIAEMYRQEHWAPIAASGGLATAVDGPSLLQEVQDALDRPEERREGRRRMVRSVLTYGDGRSADRLADLVRDTVA